MKPILFIGGPLHGQFKAIRANPHLPSRVYYPIMAPVSVSEDPKMYASLPVAEYQYNNVGDEIVYIFVRPK